MKTQGTDASGAASVQGKGTAYKGLAYKVGLGVMLAGAVMFASSSLLGDVVFAAVMDLLPFLGAPENRQFLPSSEPEAGRQMLQMHGGAVLACGVCIVSFRLIAELLGLAGKPEFTARLDSADKLGFGVAAVGLLAVVPAGLAQTLLYELFLYEYGRGVAMSTLAMVAIVGAVVLFVGLAVLVFKRPRRRGVLGWTGRVGWGKAGWGWINQLALGLIVLGLVGTALGIDELAVIATAGICILVVGIVPHILAGGRP